MAGGNLNLYVSKWDLFTGISSIESDNDIKIFPNPFNDETVLETNKLLKSGTLTVYDCLGNAIKVVDHITNKKVGLSRKDLSNGIYYILLADDNKVIGTQKLIIVD